MQMIAGLLMRLAPLRQASQASAVHQRESQPPVDGLNWINRGPSDPLARGPAVSFSRNQPASHIRLETADGSIIPLDRISGQTTLILLVSETMSILPGINHRISRRSQTLGDGVRLVCVSERETSALPEALIDRNHQIHRISGAHDAPLLLSLDQRGAVFDVVSDDAAIMDWLWNDPRPHSLREHGAMSLNDMVM